MKAFPCLKPFVTEKHFIISLLLSPVVDFIALVSFCHLWLCLSPALFEFFSLLLGLFELF